MASLQNYTLLFRICLTQPQNTFLNKTALHSRVTSSVVARVAWGDARVNAGCSFTDLRVMLVQGRC